MRYRSIRRLVGSGIVVTGLAVGVLSGGIAAGAATHGGHASASTLTVALPPGTDPAVAPSSDFPFYTGSTCTTLNIDYWDLTVRPGLYFGVGNSVAYQPNLSPLSVQFATVGGNTVAKVFSKGWEFSQSNSPSSATDKIDAQNIMFWMNLDRAQSKQGAYAACAQVPGFGIPADVLSVTAPNGLGGNEVDITFNGIENTNWLEQNEISQIVPLPLAEDLNNNCSNEPYADVATDGSDSCSTLFNTLSGYNISNPIWDWADGPYRQQSAQIKNGVPTGVDVQIANTHFSDAKYDGAHAVKTIDYVPEASETAEQNQLAKGNKSVEVGYLDGDEMGAASKPGTVGAIKVAAIAKNYTAVGGVTFGVFYWMFNYDNGVSTSTTTGPLPLWAKLANQLYFRQALQMTEDQPALIQHVLNNYALPTYSAIPTEPTQNYGGSVSNADSKYNPTGARKLMEKNGWSAATPAVCEKSGADGCGTAAYPIPKGSKAEIDVLWETGDPEVKLQTQDEIAEAKAAGIVLESTGQSIQTLGGACFAGQPLGSKLIPGDPQGVWQICAYGGWVFDPDYYPSGEDLFVAGAASNQEGYDNPEMTALIHATTDANHYNLAQVDPTYHISYAQFTADQIPVEWQPTPTAFTIQLKTIKGAKPPNPITNFNPEFITAI